MYNLGRSLLKMMSCRWLVAGAVVGAGADGSYLLLDSSESTKWSLFNFLTFRSYSNLDSRKVTTYRADPALNLLQARILANLIH